ncbi:copper amine oxidase N-terminal domain-containing protein [Paenibacillus sp. CAU 1782]
MKTTTHGRFIPKGAAVLAKSLLAASIAFGGSASLIVPASYAAEVATKLENAKLANGNDALARAKKYGLIPEDAKIVSNAPEAGGDNWSIHYLYSNGSGNVQEGTVQLRSSDGELIALKESLNADSVSGDLMAPPSHTSNEKVSYAQAIDIAIQYAEQQSWPFDHQQWMDTVIQESEYSLRWVNRDLHTVPLHRAYQNGRTPDKLYVWINRMNGDVAGHELTWTKTNYSIPQNLGTIQEAEARLFEKFQPILSWTEDSNKRLVYAFSGISETTTQTTTGIDDSPDYSVKLAKMRLLSLYDVEMVFRPDGKGNATAEYTFVPKQGIPVFYTGSGPFIDANTGEWVDYLGNPETRAMPPASPWLIDQVVPVGKTGYKAAIVWNNQLLDLTNQPIIENENTLVPFRELLTKLGARIAWDPVNRVVTASKDGGEIKLTIGSETALVNGKGQKLGTPAVIRNGFTYIPARIVLETFGAKVGWNSDSRLVLVETEASLPKLSAAELKQLRFNAHLNWAEKH